jgi:hypothetical protein
MKRPSTLNLALLAVGGGLLFLGGAFSAPGGTSPWMQDFGWGSWAPAWAPRVNPPSLAVVAGMGLLVYAAYRIKPSFGVVAGTAVLAAGYVNEHRKSMGMAPLPLIPGVSFG